MLVNPSCEKNGICRASFFTWLTKHQEFADMYAHAREIRAEPLFEEIIEIPDQLPDSFHWVDRDGKRWEDQELQDLKKAAPEEYEELKVRLVGLSKETVMRAQARVSARQWYLARLLPKRFGDKVDLTHKGKVDSEVTHVQLYIPDNQREAKPE
jgi:hypothetical protein